MTLSRMVRSAIERRIVGVERALSGVEGLFVEREGDTLRLRGRRLLRRSIEDVRLRFARFGR